MSTLQSGPRTVALPAHKRAVAAYGMCAAFAYGLYIVGCSSQPPAQAARTLSGTYFALSDSLISEITFENATEYSLMKSGCNGEQVDGEGDNGCAESGTYTFRGGILSLTDGVTKETRTFPLSVDSAEESTGSAVEILGGSPLVTGSGGLTHDTGPLVQCFSGPINEGNPTSATFGLHCPNVNQVSVDGILSRAQLWVNDDVPYCQAANHAHDDDSSCKSTCSRPGEPAAWDPYRSDCSGFVSWAWGLPPPGRTTSTFSSDIVTTIAGKDLQPGDALNRAGHHIILFIQWANASHTSAIFQEEPGCSANPSFAHQFTSNVTISGSNVSVAHNGETFKAIRYNAQCATPCQLGNDAGTTPAPPVDAGGTGTGAGTGTGTGAGAAGTCTADATCNPHGPLGMICSAGECVAGCHTSAQCPNKLACQNGECRGKSCSGDGACNPGNDGSGLICTKGVCTPGCHTNAQCPGNERCRSGMCH